MFWTTHHHKYRLKSVCHAWTSIGKSYKLIKSKADTVYTASPPSFSNYLFHQQRPTLGSFPVSSVTIDGYTIFCGSHLQISFMVIVCKCQPPGTAAMFSVMETLPMVVHWKQGWGRRRRVNRLFWRQLLHLETKDVLFLISRLQACWCQLAWSFLPVWVKPHRWRFGEAHVSGVIIDVPAFTDIQEHFGKH